MPLRPARSVAPRSPARRALFPLAVAAAAVLSACSAFAPVSVETASQALTADNLASIEFSGTGRWYQFGQAPAPDEAWPPFDVSRYVADIDYAKSAARVQIVRSQTPEPPRERPAPVEQRVDQYVAGGTAWNRAPASGGTPGAATAQPAAVADRQAEIWSTPQGFLKAAKANGATFTRTLGGTEVTFTVNGKQRYVGKLDGAGRVETIRTWTDTPVLGDTLLETRFSDYRDFNGTSFPAHIERSQGGFPVLDLKVTEVKRNPALALDVPAEVASAKPAPVTVTAQKLGDGVWYLTGGTHHSVLVEEKDHLVLIEAPLNEERSLALIAKAKELVPSKPIREVVNTHVHFDHSGGLRTFVAEGASIVTVKGNERYYERAWAAPRTLNPDRLAQAGVAPKFVTFSGKLVIGDEHPVELHEIAASGHNDAFLLAWLPQSKVVVEADAYTPVAAGAPVPQPVNPYNVNLLGNIERLKLDVAQIAALHGPRLTTLADLRAATATPVASAR
ncbi:MBL fold metallo-hydrolase [Derxia gummosa]|uniref:MBL fold metallo-hydrolase n=1 Tax=Derxia gummosa DSM 723 TaxID=1121388 RepID=A0A8B6X8V7_9BURK|nr:MBL fold metallo-hydrolase [Derxia gummosa]